MPAPTYPDSQPLAEGTGTRALPAVTTISGDWLVVEIIASPNTAGESFTPSCPGLTFSAPENDAGTGGGDVRVLQYAVQDGTVGGAGGGSRTVTITPTGGSAATRNYRAVVTIDRGSAGPGAKGTTLTAQTVTFTRTGNNSGVHMAFGDLTTTAVVTGAGFQPGSAAPVSVTDGVGADYLFGRWNDSGAAGSSAHGVNVAVTTLTTPAGAALEMLGLAAGGDEGPQTVPMFLPVLSYDPLMMATVFPMRPWQRRFQWVTQPWLNGDDAVTVAAATDAPAEEADGSGDAPDPTINVESLPAEAPGSGAALDAAIAAVTNAEIATGSGSAEQATPAVFAQAEVASGSGAANDPTVSTSSAVPVIGTNSASGTAATTTAMTLPPGTLAGHVAVLAVVQAGVQAITSTSIGASQRGSDHNGPNTIAVTVLTKVLTATDITNNSVTVTFGASQRYTVGLVVVGGQDFDSISLSTVDNAGTATSVIAAAVTPTAAGALRLSIAGGRVVATDTNVTFTPASGETEQLDVTGTGTGVTRTFLTIDSVPIAGGAGVPQGPDTLTAATAVNYVSFNITVSPTGAAPATNASAENAPGSGDAGDATALVAPNAEVAQGSGAAQDAAPAVTVNAEVASGSGAANDAIGQTAINAQAEVATGSGAASNATATVTPNAIDAAGSGVAQDPTTAVTLGAEVATGSGAANDAPPNVAPNAAEATGSGAAQAPTPAVSANAEAATGSGDAGNATVQTTGSANAPAEIATGSGSAGDATAAVAANAGITTGSGVAQDAVADVRAFAEAASGSGAALDSTVQTAGSTNAPAQSADGSGTAQDAVASVAPNAEVAVGSGVAADASTAVGAAPTAALGSGDAQDATPAVAVQAGLASGSGVAPDATVSTLTLTNAPAEVAPGAGDALSASASVSVQAGLAGGSGAANDVTVVFARDAPAEVANGSGTAPDATAAVFAQAEVAGGSGSAQNAIGQAAILAPAGLADGSGAAAQPVIAITFTAEYAAGSGSAFDVTSRGEATTLRIRVESDESDVTVTGREPRVQVGARRAVVSVGGKEVGTP